MQNVDELLLPLCPSEEVEAKIYKVLSTYEDSDPPVDID